MKPENTPIVRRLILTQILVIFIGFFLIFLSVWAASRASYNSALEKRRAEVLNHLGLFQEKWRAWKVLGLEDALSEELDREKQELGLVELRVTKEKLFPNIEDSLLVILPSDKDGKLVSYFVVAQLPSINFAFLGKIKQYFVLLILNALLFLVVVFYSGAYIRRHIGRPIDLLNKAFKKVSQGMPFDTSNILVHGEMKSFLTNINDLYQSVKEHEKKAAVAEVAKQVSHDIRSPIAALKVALQSIKDFDPDANNLIKAAIERINHIANDLLETHKERSPTDTLAVFIPEIIESILLEKKTLLGEDSKINLNYICKTSNSVLYSKIESGELKRILSNLINNSIESIGNSGRIEIVLDESEGYVSIEINDNGKGIPEGVLSQVGAKGFSFGKKDGNGLGLHHAITNIAKWEGRFEIKSELKKGTRLTLFLPLWSEPPA